MPQLHLSDQQFNCLPKCVLYYRLDGIPKFYFTEKSVHKIQIWVKIVKSTQMELFTVICSFAHSKDATIWYPLSKHKCINSYYIIKHWGLDNIFKRIFLNVNIWISLKISPNCVHKVPINNIPLSEPMVVSLLMHICVTRPQRLLNMYDIYYTFMSRLACFLHDEIMKYTPCIFEE